MEKKDLSRWALDVFSTASVRRMLRGDRSRVRSALDEYAVSLGRHCSYSELAKRLGKDLNASYRSEYVYKNAIANEVVLRRHSLRAAMLSEFRVAASVADAVVVNGRAMVYEIKTELDSASKLSKQLADYYRVFANVAVVVDERFVDRYMPLVLGTPTGLVTFDHRGHLDTVKHAEAHFGDLDVIAMMKSLRRDEYVAILRLAGIEVPDVPPVHFHRACLGSSLAIQPADYLQFMTHVLGKRAVKEPVLARRTSLQPFRYQILQIDPNRRQLESALEWLEETAR